MKNKPLGLIASILMTLSLFTLVVSFAVSNEAINVVGETTTVKRPGENWGTYDEESILASVLSKKEDGSSMTNTTNVPYVLGDYIYFAVNLQPSSEILNKDIIIKVTLKDFYTGDTSQISNFEYKNGSTWEDASRFRDTDPDNTKAFTIESVTKHWVNFRVKFNSESAYILQALCKATDDSFGRYTKVKYVKIADGKYTINQKEPETTAKQYAVTVDGVKAADVNEGGSFTLPSVAEYGYFNSANSKMYKGGSAISNINEDISLTSVNDIDIQAVGSSLLLTGETNAIRFNMKVKVKTLNNTDITDSILTTNAIRVGTLFTTEDYYSELLDEDLTFEKISTIQSEAQFYLYLLNPTNDWFKSEVGSYCIGISGVRNTNIARKFYARGYAQINYDNDENPRLCYLLKNDIISKSIKDVALRIKEIAYDTLSNDQKALIDDYCSY